MLKQQQNTSLVNIFLWVQVEAFQDPEAKEILDQLASGLEPTRVVPKLSCTFLRVPIISIFSIWGSILGFCYFGKLSLKAKWA